MKKMSLKSVLKEVDDKETMIRWADAEEGRKKEADFAEREQKIVIPLKTLKSKVENLVRNSKTEDIFDKFHLPDALMLTCKFINEAHEMISTRPDLAKNYKDAGAGHFSKIQKFLLMMIKNRPQFAQEAEEINNLFHEIIKL